MPKRNSSKISKRVTKPRAYSTYTSEPALQQKHFSRRRKSVRARPACDSFATVPIDHRTLTQSGFVSYVPQARHAGRGRKRSIDLATSGSEDIDHDVDDRDGLDEEESDRDRLGGRRVTKRRRTARTSGGRMTRGDLKRQRQQTLTQIEFVTTRPAGREDEMDAENAVDDSTSERDDAENVPKPDGHQARHSQQRQRTEIIDRSPALEVINDTPKKSRGSSQTQKGQPPMIARKPTQTIRTRKSLRESQRSGHPSPEFYNLTPPPSSIHKPIKQSRSPLQEISPNIAANDTWEDLYNVDQGGGGAYVPDNDKAHPRSSNVLAEDERMRCFRGKGKNYIPLEIPDSDSEEPVDLSESDDIDGQDELPSIATALRQRDYVNEGSSSVLIKEEEHSPMSSPDVSIKQEADVHFNSVERNNETDDEHVSVPGSTRKDKTREPRESTSMRSNRTQWNNAATPSKPILPMPSSQATTIEPSSSSATPASISLQTQTLESPSSSSPSTYNRRHHTRYQHLHHHHHQETQSEQTQSQSPAPYSPTLSASASNSHHHHHHHRQRQQAKAQQSAASVSSQSSAPSSPLLLGCESRITAASLLPESLMAFSLPKPDGYSQFALAGGFEGT